MTAHSYMDQLVCWQATAETKEDQLYETWLLLEYCDKGSLQSAVDRGWFHTDTHGHVDSQARPNMQAIRSAFGTQDSPLGQVERVCVRLRYELLSAWQISYS